MIVGNLKSVEEIAASVAGHRNVLVVGCGSCVTVCLSGGDREARQLADELALPLYYPDAPPPAFAVNGILRQCEKDLVKTYLTLPPETDAVLSLACGAGVQTLADVFSPLPVFPALNTTFLGALDEPGTWREKCHGCGDCVLSFTGSICPVARCAKSLFNGPCGGSQGGRCEVDPDLLPAQKPEPARFYPEGEIPPGLASGGKHRPPGPDPHRHRRKPWRLAYPIESNPLSSSIKGLIIVSLRLEQITGFQVFLLRR
jgi:ferredoxin